MITIYTSPSCASCKKVKEWLDSHNIPYREKNIFTSVLDPEELKSILRKTENGTDDIISKRSNVFKNTDIDIDDMKISELIDFIIKNPSILKRPIMVDDKKIQVGYNKYDISSFIPQAKRIAESACLNCKDSSCTLCKLNK